jgi:hypothetical protein
MKITACCCSAFICLFATSCMPGSPEMPADQAAKMRVHRMTPSEDLQEIDRTRGGSPLPATSEGSWKF